MKSSAFVIEEVQELRRQAEEARAVPDCGPAGWSRSDVDPLGLLRVFSKLRVQVGFVLRAYEYRSDSSNSTNGNGVVWAVPEEVGFPEPEDCPTLNGYLLRPPKPIGASDNLMEAIAGDGSPLSYLQASIFAREAAEFGALWHGRSWSDTEILGAAPWADTAPRRTAELGASPRETWQWFDREPRDWAPTVFTNGERQCRFLTYSPLGQEAISLNTDIYADGSYRFQRQSKEVATGPAYTVH